MIRKSLMIFAIVSIALVIMFGPGTADAMLSFAPADFIPASDIEEREEFHQTYPLTGNGRVSVENLNGFVHVKVWDRDAVQVDAVKRANRRDRLDEAKIDVYATPESIRIKTVYPDRDQTFTDDEKGRYNNPATVDYTLTVPRKARLESIELVNGSLEVDGAEGSVKASSINGKVSARNLSGETRLSTVNGNLDATFTLLTETSPISLGSVNGNVTLIIPSDSSATVRAGTVHGDINNDFGLDVDHGEYVGHGLNGQIGNGGPRIKLSNVNGTISIKRAQDGKKLSAAVSLQSNKAKEKDKLKELTEARRAAAAQRAQNAEDRLEAQQAAEEQRRATRQLRESQREIQREVEQAIREAQREIERAQREIQLETERQVREMRMENRGFGRGTGRGSGRGEGVGDARLLDRESKSFAVSGQARVNVGTFDGAVTVHGWDKSEVMYTATKRAGTEDELKQIEIESEQQGSTVSIIAKSSQSAGSAAVDVYVPRGANLHVSSDDGQLNIEGVSGRITLRTGDGSIQVSDSKGQLEANTGDGHIRIANFDGQVDARTGDGAIALEGKFTELSARTGGGSITLAVPADSNFTVETNAEAISNEGLNVSEDIAPSPRLKRWRVGHGGQVFVLTTGDGKIVLRNL
ncbi:MAG TPA: DUF4097 family beta strand repeat-containing protein [Pyrinomonadaceae bacterium]|nr:DUF4097 family beta strand repeat-containing protein [Pyrinomonadaceae bacterium]